MAWIFSFMQGFYNFEAFHFSRCQPLEASLDFLQSLPGPVLRLA